jgi:hypothetical protein
MERKTDQHQRASCQSRKQVRKGDERNDREEKQYKEERSRGVAGSAEDRRLRVAEANDEQRRGRNAACEPHASRR